MESSPAAKQYGGPSRLFYPGSPTLRRIPPESLSADRDLLRAAFALGLTGWVAEGEAEHVLVGRAREQFEAALRRALKMGSPPHVGR